MINLETYNPEDTPRFSLVNPNFNSYFRIVRGPIDYIIVPIEKFWDSEFDRNVRTSWESEDGLFEIYLENLRTGPTTYNKRLYFSEEVKEGDWPAYSFRGISFKVSELQKPEQH